MSKIAVVRTGGKQYVVKEKDTIKAEKLNLNVGDKLDLEVLMLGEEDGSKVEVGQPVLSTKSRPGREQGRAKHALFTTRIKPVNTKLWTQATIYEARNRISRLIQKKASNVPRSRGVLNLCSIIHNFVVLSHLHIRDPTMGNSRDKRVIFIVDIFFDQFSNK